MKHNGPNDSAFPSFAEINGREVVGSDGLTVREYFAAQAMVGLLAGYSGAFPVPESVRIAELSFAFADAMIRQSQRQ